MENAPSLAGEAYDVGVTLTAVTAAPSSVPLSPGFPWIARLWTPLTRMEITLPESLMGRGERYRIAGPYTRVSPFAYATRAFYVFEEASVRCTEISRCEP